MHVSVGTALVPPGGLRHVSRLSRRLSPVKDPPVPPVESSRGQRRQRATIPQPDLWEVRLLDLAVRALAANSAYPERTD